MGIALTIVLAAATCHLRYWIVRRAVAAGIRDALPAVRQADGPTDRRTDGPTDRR
ncbi:hypothetical protein FM112_10005 [Gulosibacter sp. 10]|nr:hypothetical protein FM112_10005 [Gulosibacter sp. 10]